LKRISYRNDPDKSVVANANTCRLVIVERLTELDWIVDVVSSSVKADQYAN
jgi:hypothetical protein